MRAPAKTAAERHLDWEGCFNVRDLGGLPAAAGARTRRGALVRADAVEGLTASGWSALWAHGIRTVIDLRNEDERGPDVAARPAGLTTAQLALDGVEDREFWERWGAGPEFGTPLYYAAHLERFPQRNARVIAAVARAEPGGVLVHCVGGRDRTGQVTMLALALAGVPVTEIAGDYELSSERLRARHAASGEEDDGPLLASFLAERGTTAQEVLISTLASLDVEAYLRDAGLSAGDLAALRARLLEPPRAAPSVDPLGLEPS